ncbi:hypothetical protein VNO77_42453 [Canavalia gladiata]|uniref:Uncharacterized protein n=1 Tax=Canavalia gladiata TaxID=3824 RepID=A0AAN9JSU4_CANGL
MNPLHRYSPSLAHGDSLKLLLLDCIFGYRLNTKAPEESLDLECFFKKIAWMAVLSSSWDDDPFPFFCTLLSSTPL